ncbi:hypothetical protein LMG33818_002650 [Halomonadaceae bacterium LMG 33818]|uniref:XRE family transcriptional regulator n=1 Tax=Cernens ardua TaxID=3402176 RepID=UPI003EDBFE3D
MNKFGDRIRAERKRLGLSQSEIAHIGGVTYATQSNYENDKRIPDSNYLSSLLSAGVDVMFILTGGQSRLPEACNDISIPLYDVSASAGAGSAVLAEEVHTYWNITTEVARLLGLRGKSHIGVRVRGDSMEPTLMDNGWAIINCDDTEVERSGVFVVRCGNELRVKRIQPLMSGELMLISDNKMYNPETINLNTNTDIGVLGRVVYQLGELK